MKDINKSSKKINNEKRKLNLQDLQEKEIKNINFKKNKPDFKNKINGLKNKDFVEKKQNPFHATEIDWLEKTKSQEPDLKIQKTRDLKLITIVTVAIIFGVIKANHLYQANSIQKNLVANQFSSFQNIKVSPKVFFGYTVSGTVPDKINLKRLESALSKNEGSRFFDFIDVVNLNTTPANLKFEMEVKELLTEKIGINPQSIDVTYEAPGYIELEGIVSLSNNQLEAEILNNFPSILFVDSKLVFKETIKIIDFKKSGNYQALALANQQIQTLRSFGFKSFEIFYSPADKLEAQNLTAELLKENPDVLISNIETFDSSKSGMILPKSYFQFL